MCVREEEEERRKEGGEKSNKKGIIAIKLEIDNEKKWWRLTHPVCLSTRRLFFSSVRVGSRDWANIKFWRRRTGHTTELSPMTSS